MIRKALLEAADHIAQHPETFDFSSGFVPDDVDVGPGSCALGWLAAKLRDNGVANPAPVFGDRWHYEAAAAVLGLHSMQFYERMRRLVRWWEPPWSDSPKTAARCLRRYADKYHKEVEVPAVIVA